MTATPWQMLRVREGGRRLAVLPTEPACAIVRIEVQETPERITITLFEERDADGLSFRYLKARRDACV